MATSYADEMNDQLFEYTLIFDRVDYLNDKAVFSSKIPITLAMADALNDLGETIKQALNQIKIKNSMEVLQLRLVDNLTLADTGEQLGITRERVRQIENSTLRKLSALFPQELTNNLLTEFEINPIILLEQLPIQDTVLRKLTAAIIAHKDFRRRLIFDTDLQAFVKDKTYTYHNLKTTLGEFLASINEPLCTQDELISYLLYLFPLLKPTFIIDNLMEKNDIQILEDQRYFFYSLYRSKREKIEFVYSLYPDGFETTRNFSELKQQLKKFFPGIFDEDSQRAIIGLAQFSDQVLLWEWGNHIHKKFVEDIINNYDFSDLLSYLDQELANVLAVDLDGYFNANEQHLREVGIPSKYALHTLLKLKYPDEYSFQDAPRIASAGTERLELKEILLNAMSEPRVYSLDELCQTLNSPRDRVQQLVDRLEEVIIVDTFHFLKRTHLNVDISLLHEIIGFANEQVKKLNYFYIGLIIEKFRERLHVIAHYNRETTLLDLLKKYTGVKEFNVSNTRIIHKRFPITRKSFNFHYQIEQLIGERPNISKNEIHNYFVERGLDAKIVMQYFHYSKYRSIIRLDDETFTSMSLLGITPEIITTLTQFIEKRINGEHHLDDLLDDIRNDHILHVVPWNRMMVCDVVEKDLFRFSPSADNPLYIEYKKGEI